MKKQTGGRRRRRKSKKTKKNLKDWQKASKIKKGMLVSVKIKPYKGKTKKGKVGRVLTKKDHPRGIKVELTDKNKTVGRVFIIYTASK